MLPEFQKFIDDNQLIRHGEKILLAVSGGIDSMVMAHLFLRMNYSCGIAHCNFSLRDAESDGDEQLVRSYAQKNNIPFFSVRFKTKNYAREHGLSVQMAARELRYTWFEEIRVREKFDLVAIAHNLNDNIETLLINLTRGTGLTGLTGISPSSGKIIRPLLFATRKLISDYSSHYNVEFREDRSNADTKYTRNKIRHLVIPVLKEINPALEDTLNETAGRLAELNDALTDYVKQISTAITSKIDNYTILNISKLQAYSHNRSLIFEIFREYGVAGAQLDDLMNLLSGRTGSKLLTDTHRLIRNRDEIIITGKSARDDEPELFTDTDNLLTSSMLSSVEIVPIDGSFMVPRDPSIACLDYDSVKFPLTIRNWKPGDFFIPLGMRHQKKLSDYFIDRKYSIPEKEDKHILESDGKIVWIIGDRIDDRFKITPGSKNALIIRRKT
jgi:tRNA(Ile)-lysidine synthase